MGCNSNCFINCADGTTSDQCVQYTGPDIPALGICQGDQLSTVEQAILTNLQAALEGTGITPDQVTLENCAWLQTQFVGENQNLSTLLQLLIDSSCSLKGMIDIINAQLVTQAISFNTLCLQGLPLNPTINDILQAAINIICTINTTVAAIPATYVKASDINTIVQQQITIYLANSQSGNIEYFQYLPIGGILPYHGALSNFDNTGKGLAAFGLTNMFLCNGLNGTPDYRGLALVGAIRNVPGAALNPLIDPANPDNPNWAIDDILGENKHLLTITEIPAHTHTLNDPGHTHPLIFKNAVPLPASGGSTVVPSLGSNSITPISLAAGAGISTTGITLQSSGGSQKHNNIQPSIATFFIIRML
jgi:hypothetical protein